MSVLCTCLLVCVFIFEDSSKYWVLTNKRKNTSRIHIAIYVIYVYL